MKIYTVKFKVILRRLFALFSSLLRYLNPFPWRFEVQKHWIVNFCNILIDLTAFDNWINPLSCISAWPVNLKWYVYEFFMVCPIRVCNSKRIWCLKIISIYQIFFDIYLFVWWLEILIFFLSASANSEVFEIILREDWDSFKFIGYCENLENKFIIRSLWNSDWNLLIRIFYWIVFMNIYIIH